MIEKGQVCTLLFEMIKDEEKAQIEYQQLKAELTRKSDKAQINKIMKDEARHAKKIKGMYARLTCSLL